MENPISTLGWVLIIFLGVFILAINLGLFMGIRKKNNKTNWISKIQATSQVLKDPFHDEYAKMAELSEKLKKLQTRDEGVHAIPDDTTQPGDKNE